MQLVLQNYVRRACLLDLYLFLAAKKTNSSFVFI